MDAYDTRPLAAGAEWGASDALGLSGSLSARELLFVVGAQELYGADILSAVDEHARQIAAELDAAQSIPTRVNYRGVVVSAETATTICNEANASSHCVGVIIWAHTFSPAKSWIPLFGGLRQPLLHLHTQYNSAIPWADIDMDYMNLNQSAHADRELAFMATRMGVRRKTVVGHWRDGQVVARIGAWARAACGWHELQHLSIARFGDNMRGVAVTEGDKLEAQVRLGVAVNAYPVNELAEAIDSATDDEVGALAGRYEELYRVAPELRRGGDRHGALLDAARIELGLRSFLATGGFGAFTDNFEDLGSLPHLPGIAVQRLMAEGYGFGAEGDWKTAALVRAVKVMSAGLPGGASFMEDYTYDMVHPTGLVLGAHMLEVCPSLADDCPTCEIHPLTIGGKPDPVRLVFDAAAGPAVNVTMIDLGDRFRLVLNEVNVVGPEHPLPRLPVARAVWAPEPTLVEAAEMWMAAGGGHHTVLSTALDTATLIDFAEALGVELVIIDARSEPVQFMKELRWNEAYHRLVSRT